MGPSNDKIAQPAPVPEVEAVTPAEEEIVRHRVGVIHTVVLATSLAACESAGDKDSCLRDAFSRIAKNGEDLNTVLSGPHRREFANAILD
jgi:hypothetical protein